MTPNLRAIKGELNESTNQKLIDISKLDPNIRLLTGCLFGDYYPVQTLFEAGENLITIDLPIPRIVGAKSKRIDDSRKGSLSIKKLREETHILSLDVKGYGNLYTDVIDISQEVLDVLMGDSKDNCGMFHMGQNRLMAVLYDDGHAVDFTGGYLVPEKPDPIVEFITVGCKGLLEQGVAEAESMAEIAEETTREIIDTETTEEPTYARIDPDFFDERYTIAEISDKYGIKKQMLHNAVTVTKKLIKDEDGKISMRNLTKWMLELRTTKKTPESDRVALFNSVYQTDFTERGQAAEYLTGSDFHIEKTKTKKKLD